MINGKSQGEVVSREMKNGLMQGWPLAPEWLQSASIPVGMDGKKLSSGSSSKHYHGSACSLLLWKKKNDLLSCPTAMGRY